jgi:hypothetical protein
MQRLDTKTAEKFVIATSALMQFKAPAQLDDRRTTVMFSFGIPGRMTERDLASSTAELDLDVVHLEFEPGSEAAGPTNLALSEDRNGEILTWPRCDLWADEDRRIFLVVPSGKDFGFAYDGAALVRVTDLSTGAEMDRGIMRARRMLMSAARKVPGALNRMTRTVARPSGRPGDGARARGDREAGATDDERRAIELRRLAAVSDPVAVSTMKRYATAASLLVAGKPGREMTAPEPLVQVGFEPDEQEMQLLTFMAEKEGRDVIHVGCHPDGSGRPTGMIAVVCIEKGKARPHRRAGLLCEPGGTEVILSGVSDQEDERCHFVMAPGGKMTRVPGHPVADIGSGMNRAGELWHALANSLLLGDCEDEPLAMYSMIDVTPSRGTLQ